MDCAEVKADTTRQQMTQKNDKRLALRCVAQVAQRMKHTKIYEELDLEFFKVLNYNHCHESPL